jgi:hypothetical protein
MTIPSDKDAGAPALTAYHPASEDPRASAILAGPAAWLLPFSVLVFPVQRPEVKERHVAAAEAIPANDRQRKCAVQTWEAPQGGELRAPGRTQKDTEETAGLPRWRARWPGEEQLYSRVVPHTVSAVH